jgi:hypothetical protein
LVPPVAVTRGRIDALDGRDGVGGALGLYVAPWTHVVLHALSTLANIGTKKSRQTHAVSEDRGARRRKGVGWTGADQTMEAHLASNTLLAPVGICEFVPWYARAFAAGAGADWRGKVHSACDDQFGITPWAVGSNGADGTWAGA